ncbi:MAG TPA: anti-phage dCTP deaminase [Xanthobacteraceae bacterium]|nr:anti-phage dCTP deaminase [Xanthobacteraceae bacterium]
MAVRKQAEASSKKTHGVTPVAGVDSKTAVLQHAANELIFAVVGHVGSGTSTVANVLAELLASSSLPGGEYDVEVLRARNEIEGWARSTGHTVPATKRTDLGTTVAFQDLGDEMRLSTKDNSAVARALIRSVRETRAKKMGLSEVGDGPVKPDGKRRAYILESLRNPEEVELLRHVYQEAFILIGVVCDAEKRVQRIMKKYENAGRVHALEFMKRDARGGGKHGQQVSDTFHLSDFFVDNTTDRENPDGTGNPDWGISDHLSRLLKIISRNAIVRPEISETAMHDAFSASVRSACLSRQVGAALVDSVGNVIATGTNEVPRAGGGVYGEHFQEGEEDNRCAFRKLNEPAFCSNTRQQNELVKKLIDEVEELKNAKPERHLSLPTEIRGSGVGDLLEFSRAVHAEMDALLSAGRTGASTIGTRLFVTTYPCHYCARHIVSAGVDKVEYIEPYPKSQAVSLHADSITTDAKDWVPPSQGGKKVLFQPFVGVAPRMYRRAFVKDRDLKNKHTGVMIKSDPEWGTPWHLRSAAYVELEAYLSKAET